MTKTNKIPEIMKLLLTCLFVFSTALASFAQCDINFDLAIEYDRQSTSDCNDNLSFISITPHWQGYYSGSYEVLIDGQLSYTGSDASTLINIASSNEQLSVVVRDVDNPFCFSEQTFWNTLTWVDIEQASAFCEIDKMGVPLTAYSNSNNLSYYWSTGETEAEILATDAGSYSVTATPITNSSIEVLEDQVEVLDSEGESVPFVHAPSNLASNYIPPAGNWLTFDLLSACAPANTTICQALRLSNFTDVNDFQFSLAFDPSHYEFVSIQNIHPELADFSTSNIDTDTEGQVAVQWASTAGQTLSNGSTLFEICITLNNEFGTGDISFVDTPFATQAHNSMGEALNVSTHDSHIATHRPNDSLNGSHVYMNDQCAQVGDSICIPLQVNDFSDILGFQFTINYDASALNYTGAQNLSSSLIGFLDGASIGTPGPGGLVTITWNDPFALGVTMADDAIIVELCFQVTAESGNADIGFSSVPTAIEFVDNTETVVNFNLPTATVYIQEDQHNNYENEFSLHLGDATTIGNEQLCLPLQAQAFTNINEVHWALQYDINQLDFVGAQQTTSLLTNFTPASFSEANDGIILLDWLHPDGDGLSVGTGTHLANLCFQSVDEICPIVQTHIIEDLENDCFVLEGQIQHTLDCDPSSIQSTTLANWMVAISGDDFLEYVFSDENGHYQAYLASGNYNLELIAPSPLWGICESSISVNIDGSTDVYTQDLYTQTPDVCPLFEVNTTVSSLLRPCSENRWIRINYENIGTSILNDGLIAILLAEEMTYSSSSVPLFVQGDTLLYQLNEPLDIGESGYFRLYVDLDCDVVIGQTLCVKAIGLSSGLCPSPDEQWSGASLQAQGNCTEENVAFSIRNIGTATMAEAGSYIVIQDGVMLLEGSNTFPPLAPDEAFTLDYPANGSTYRIEVMQEAFHPGQSMPVAVVEGCASSSDDEISLGFVQQFFNDDFDVHIDEDCREVTASYDPNDKQAEPKGYGDAHYVNIDQEMEYTIRFQNTGTDTAFLVVIRDTLSEHLDMTSLRPAGSSHPFELQLDSANAISFVFENILLPDSTTNLAASQGFVKYKISPLPDIELETVVENTAAIYFDYNEPVITNTTYHTFGEHFIEIVNWTQNYKQEGNWHVFPNPVQNQLTILQESRQANSLLIISDALGRTRLEQQLSAGSNSIELDQLQTGWYSFQIKSETGLVLGTGRLIKIN